MHQLLGHSITYRIAMGPNQGRKVFTLQTLPACDPDDCHQNSVGSVAGISLHAGVSVDSHTQLQRKEKHIRQKRGKRKSRDQKVQVKDLGENNRHQCYKLYKPGHSKHMKGANAMQQFTLAT